MTPATPTAETLRTALAHTVTAVTALPGLPPARSGKVRDAFDLGDGTMLLVTSDRVSAFDRVLGTIPYKGQVLNQLAAWWFERTRHLVPNHLLSIPDPNAMLVRKATPLPVEVVVRGFLTGVTSTSLWTLYQRGESQVYGLSLPPGLPKNARLPTPVITPTTKAEAGQHDHPLAAADVATRGLVPAALWERVCHAALALFAEGQAVAEAAGLLLVDTKYEFGTLPNPTDPDHPELVLIDEVHTPDSSRYWSKAAWEAGRAEPMDKELLRLALADLGYRGDGPPPPLPDELRVRLAATYIALFERLTGTTFTPVDGDVASRLAQPSLTAAHPGPREACGVFGIVAKAGGVDVAKSTFYALYALQHRGQESAGIAVMGEGGIQAVKGMGLVTQVFTEKDLAPLRGELAIGHTRYSTAGASTLLNAQPYVIHTGKGPLALAHNGNLTNAPRLRQILLRRGVGLISESDSELLTQLLAQPVPGDDDFVDRIVQTMRLAEGAYSLAVLTSDAVYAVRDPHGFRPLYLGALDAERGWVVASESCAFGTIGARLVHEIEPGTIIKIDRHGPTVIRPDVPKSPPAFCSFEYVYFARPDSILEGQLVHATRQRLGRQLARESPVAADLVVGVPDSALPAALGFAAESKIPYGEGLIKNRYIGRTFIQPTQELRRSAVSLKFNPLGENLAGRRVVLVDDSIVRGTTAGPIVQLLRDAGAREVHVRVSSPPVRHPCYMGVDMPDRQDLIAHFLSPDEIARRIGADSCAFLSHEGLLAAIRDASARSHCSACFSGLYPIEVEHGA